MADEFERAFEEASRDVQIDIPDELVTNPAINKYSNQNLISGKQRWLLNNVFDSQPARRRAYLKKYGFEMSPDGEGYKPIGLKTKFIPIELPGSAAVDAAGAIDQDTGAMVPGSFGVGDPKKKLEDLKAFFSSDSIKELASDAGDITWDVLISTPLQAISGFIGGAATAPAGPVVSVVGAGVGTAAGEAISESMKIALGDKILEEDVPADMEEYLTRVTLAGTFGAVAKGGGQAVNKLRKMSVKSYKNALDEVLTRKLGGTPISRSTAERVMADPEIFSPEKIKGEGKKLLEFRKELTGASADKPKSTKDLGGIAREKISDLNDRVDLEVLQLSKNRDADVSVQDLLNVLKEKSKRLRVNAHYDGAGDDGAEALDYINKKMKELKDTYRIEAPAPSIILDESGKPFARGEAVEEYRDMNFKQARDYIKGISKATFAKGGVMTENWVVKDVSSGLKEFIDFHAGELGSELPALKAQQHKILRADAKIKEVLTPAMVQHAYMGPEGNTSRQLVREAMSEFDAAVGTTVAPTLESTQFKTKVEDLFFTRKLTTLPDGTQVAGAQVPNEKDFGRSLLEAAREGYRAGAGGMPLNPTIRIGSGMLEAAQNARVNSAFKSPDVLIKRIKQTSDKLTRLSKDPTVLELITQPWKYPGRMVGAAGAAGASQAFGNQPGEDSFTQPPMAPPPEQAQAPDGSSADAEFEAAFEEATRGIKLPTP